MWLGLTLLVLGVVAVIVAIFAGGIFTITLFVFAALAVAGAVATGVSTRATGVDQPRGFDRDPRPGHVQATPDDLVDERRRQQ